jgi:hypothetical protein
LELTHHFTPFDCEAGCLHRFKSRRGTDYPFQLAMVAFNDVFPVFNLTVFNVRRTPAFAFEQRERTAVCRSFIRVDEVGICQPFTLFKIFPRKQYAALL